MSEVIGIKGRLRQINVQCDEHGRIEMDDDEARHARAPRTPGIRAGTSNLGVNNILIFDFDGDPDFINPEDDKATHKNVHVELKTVHGRGKETVTVFTDNGHEWKADNKSAFEGIRAEADAKVKTDVSHFRCTTNDGSMRCSFRQVRQVGETTYVSNWVGADDSEGFRVGRQ